MMWPAKRLCILCWWSSRAGCLGPASRYAFRPNAPSGHYQRHVDVAHGINMKALAKSMPRLRVARYMKCDGARTIHEMQVKPPHLSFLAELEEDPSIMRRLADMVASESLPRSYAEHEVVKSNDDLVLPCSIYVDGVPTTRKKRSFRFLDIQLGDDAATLDRLIEEV